MTADNSMNRWRPRFSVRTLVIVVTLVCCYFALWEATKKRGVEDVRDRAGRQGRWAPLLAQAYMTPRRGPRAVLLKDNAATRLPCIVGIDRLIPDLVGERRRRRHYYFWFFGYVAKLPWERELEPRVFALPTMPPLPPRSASEEEVTKRAIRLMQELMIRELNAENPNP